jgi:hypothetical protein
MPSVARDVARNVLDRGPASRRGGARDVRLTSNETEDRSGAVAQWELQEDIQRFTGELLERIGQALMEIERSGTSSEATEALRRALNYESAALDIASQPLPEVAVLDMLVFLRLNRSVLAEYWIPKVFGERGRPFLTAFEQAEQQFSPIIDKIQNVAERDGLVRRIDEWRNENPDLVLVEFVRLTDFSRHAGSVALAGAKVGGMLASVHHATQAADQAILLGERALFLANKLPFVIRHQVRLGGREVALDAAELLNATEAVTTSLKQLQPLVDALPAVEAGGIEVARENRLLAKDIQALIPTQEQIARLERAIDTTGGVMKNVSALIDEVRTAMSGRPNTMRRALGYLVVLGASWSVAWWGCYGLAKRFARAGS